VGIIECFGAEFLRRPTVVDTQRLLAKTREHGLYALAVAQLSSRLAGLIYTGDIKHPTIILEAVVSHNVGSGMLFLSHWFQ
jgi:hypothetical protein